MAIPWYRQNRTRPRKNREDGAPTVSKRETKSRLNGWATRPAIELLKANAGDYPASASAQFGLGRAYEAAGDMASARAAFSRALKIDPNFRKATDGLNALR
jgi:tetratricopeptide (TPR) repeat protein